MKTFRNIVATAAIMAFAATPVAGQQPDGAAYPTRPISLIMPLAVGSAGDVLGRVVAAKMSIDLGKPVVNENITGASGVIGIERMLRAPPDGYTLLGTGDNQLIYAPLFNKESRFHALKDFQPITQLAVLDWVLVANPGFPARTIAELVALAKEKPGAINFASGGLGSAQQIAMELLMARTGIKLTHVPYRGVTPGLTDVASGQVQLMFTAVSVAAPFLPDGRLRIIATAGLERSPLLPDVPTIAESGVEGFEFRTWMGLLAQSGTPPEVVKRLRAAASAAIKDPSIRSQLDAGGFVPVGNTPDEFRAVLERDYHRIAEIMRSAGIAPK